MTGARGGIPRQGRRMSLATRVSVRRARGSDWPGVESLLRANHLPLDGARDHLANFVVAVEGSDLVGCAGAEVYGDTALGRSVAVASARRGQGVGRLLVEALLAEAGRRGVCQLYLLTTTAAGYFEAYGFRRAPIEEAPASLSASAEFRGACPASATFMRLGLAATEPGRKRESEG